MGEAMNMDNTKWRSKTRYVIIFDLLLTLIVVILALLTIVAFFKDINVVDRQKALAYTALAFTFIVAITGCVEIWFAVMLLNATKLGEDFRLALRRAKIYLVLNVIILIGVAVATGLIAQWPYLGVHTALRPLVMIVVLLFVQELNAISTPSDE